MEVVVKINDGPAASSYKDGDIVQAFTLDEIYYHHAQQKCNVRNFGLETNGSRTADPLLINFLEKTKTYKFERINSNYVKRTNLITSEETILGKTANEDGERIDPYQYEVPTVLFPMFSLTLASLRSNGALAARHTLLEIGSSGRPGLNVSDVEKAGVGWRI